MGCFSGVLLVSDFDDTLVDRKKHLPERTRTALNRFVSEGGCFTLASGRGLESVRKQAPGLPINAPVIVATGTQIYDLKEEKLLYEASFSPNVENMFRRILSEFPEAAAEIYGNGHLYCIRPNEITKFHLELTRQTATETELAEVPWPWVYGKLEDTNENLHRMQDIILAEYADVCGAFFSHEFLLEINPAGINKGTGALRLAELLGMDRMHLYCAGDNQNDVDMLRAAELGFVPKGSTSAALQVADVVVCDCDEGAVADVVAYLERKYRQ